LSMKANRKKQDLMPDFSDEIQQTRSDSFFQVSFKIVHRLLFMFVMFFVFLLSIAFIFSHFFYVDLKVEGMGVLEPDLYKEVRSGLTATVENIFVSNGDKVAKGDLLARLSELEFRIRLSQAESDLVALRAELKRRIEQYKLPVGDLDTIRSYVKIRAGRNGIINKIFVKQGERVRKNELLARLSDFENRIQLYQSQKDLEVSEAELKRRIEKYELSYAMYKDLIPKLAKAKTLDDIPEIAVQRAIVEKVTRQVELLNYQVEKASIRSPISGKVLSSNIEDLIGKRVAEDEVIMLIGTKAGVPEEAAYCLINPRTIPEIAEQEALIVKLTHQIKLLNDQIEKTRMVAPMDGTIVTPDLHRKLGSLVTKGETLMVVAQLDDWVVKAFILEKDVPKLKLGYRANVKINAFPFMEFKMFGGRIIDIDHTPTPVANQALLINEGDHKDTKPSLYFTVTIQLDDAGAFKSGKKIDFKYGLLANVNIIISKKRIIVYLWELFLGKLDFFSNISR